jgi:hypothetical protein
MHGEIQAAHERACVAVRRARGTTEVRGGSLFGGRNKREGDRHSDVGPLEARPRWTGCNFLFGSTFVGAPEAE